MKRPWWCQDPTCTPDSADVGARIGSFDKAPEESGFCCGRVAEPMELTRHGRTHVNDGHFCFRSAVRGVTMLEINSGDLDIISRTAVRSLVARDPTRHFNGRWYTGREEGWGADNPPGSRAR
jgi:hypothetical protein